MASKRIEEDLRDITNDPLMKYDPLKMNLPNSSATAGPVGDDLFNWEATIKGPKDSPYAGGVFKLAIHFTPNYPLDPPVITFLTKVYHPNINSQGTIRLAILKERWTSAYSISRVLMSVLALLMNPNTDDPLVPDIAHLCKTNRAKYEETARDWTRKYAIDAPAQTEQVNTPAITD